MVCIVAFVFFFNLKFMLKSGLTKAMSNKLLTKFMPLGVKSTACQTRKLNWQLIAQPLFHCRWSTHAMCKQNDDLNFNLSITPKCHKHSTWCLALLPAGPMLIMCPTKQGRFSKLLKGSHKYLCSCGMPSILHPTRLVLVLLRRTPTRHALPAWAAEIWNYSPDRLRP